MRHACCLPPWCCLQPVPSAAQTSYWHYERCQNRRLYETDGKRQTFCPCNCDRSLPGDCSGNWVALATDRPLVRPGTTGNNVHAHGIRLNHWLSSHVDPSELSAPSRREVCLARPWRY